MARPIKTGLDYFNFDVDFFQDIKVRRIKLACGPQSVSVLICLLCNIYRDKGYYIRWDDDLSFLVADEIGASEGAVIETIKKAVQVGFFDQEMSEKKILTSIGIQKRYSKIVKDAKRTGCKIDPKFSLAEIKKELITEETELITEETKLIHGESTQSKVKESKVNKRKESDKEKTVSDPDGGGGFLSPPKHQFFKIDALHPVLASSQVWKESVAMHQSISIKSVDEWLSKFIGHLKASGEEEKSLPDAKKHFASWIRIKMNFEKDNPQPGTRIIFDNPEIPPDNSGKWLWLNEAWRDTSKFTNYQKKQHGIAV